MILVHTLSASLRQHWEGILQGLLRERKLNKTFAITNAVLLFKLLSVISTGCFRYQSQSNLCGQIFHHSETQKISLRQVKCSPLPSHTKLTFAGYKMLSVNIHLALFLFICYPLYFFCSQFTANTIISGNWTREKLQSPGGVSPTIALHAHQTFNKALLFLVTGYHSSSI